MKLGSLQGAFVPKFYIHQVNTLLFLTIYLLWASAVAITEIASWGIEETGNVGARLLTRFIISLKNIIYQSVDIRKLIERFVKTYLY